MATRLPAGSPRLIRRLNSAHVLSAIRAQGPTVNEVVEGLLRDGTVLEDEANGAQRPSRPGRPARLLRFRADLGYVLGIDIGANKVLVLVADLNGDVVGSERRRVGARERAGSAPLLRHARFLGFAFSFFVTKSTTSAATASCCSCCC